MEKHRVITNFSMLSDSELLKTVKNAVLNLKDNKGYVFTEGKLTDLDSKATELTDAIAKSINGGRLVVQKKNDVRLEVEFKLSDIAKTVNLQANYNLAMLESTGLPLIKEAESYPEFPAPKMLKLKSGIAHGEIIVEVPVQKKTRIYCIYHSKMPAAAEIKEWNHILSTKHKATITGLTPGDQIAVKAGYVGTNGKINLSETFTIYVQ